MNVLVLEEASLELLPPKFYSTAEARSVEERFGTSPSQQLLDQNYHSKIVASLHEREKRGRPDVVHFALLDATSTPLFEGGHLEVYVRTREAVSIQIKSETRLPRTLHRFSGLVAKLLSRGVGNNEEKFFSVEKDQTFEALISKKKIQKVIAFSTSGVLVSLHDVVAQEMDRARENTKRTAWIIGGFAHGDFRPEVFELSDRVVSISEIALPAHVVSARLCYELENCLKI